MRKMELGEPDASGRRRPVEVAGSDYTIDVDAVIMSLGTSPNPLISSKMCIRDSLLIPYRHGLSCHLFFSLFFFSPFTFIFSSPVIFFQATSLSAILLSSSHKIPFSYSHLHFPSHKTALNIFPLPNPSEIPSPIFIILPAIHTAPAITANRASQYINADPSPIFHQQIFPSAPGY